MSWWPGSLPIWSEVSASSDFRKNSQFYSLKTFTRLSRQRLKTVLYSRLKCSKNYWTAIRSIKNDSLTRRTNCTWSWWRERRTKISSNSSKLRRSRNVTWCIPKNRFTWRLNCDQLITSLCVYQLGLKSLPNAPLVSTRSQHRCHKLIHNPWRKSSMICESHVCFDLTSLWSKMLATHQASPRSPFLISCQYARWFQIVVVTTVIQNTYNCLFSLESLLSFLKMIEKHVTE